jgi:hypothetical protein
MSTGPLRENLEYIMNDSWKSEVDAFMKSNYLKRDGIDVKKNRFYQQVHEQFVDAKKLAWLQMQEEFPELAERVKNRQNRNKILQTGDVDYLLQQFPK